MENKEKEFNEWLKSIEFVTAEGNKAVIELVPDTDDGELGDNE